VNDLVRAIHHKRHKRTKSTKAASSFLLCAFCPFVFFVVNCSYNARLRILYHPNQLARRKKKGSTCYNAPETERQERDCINYQHNIEHPQVVHYLHSVFLGKKIHLFVSFVVNHFLISVSAAITHSSLKCACLIALCIGLPDPSFFALFRLI
jgi:hypothetical protein